MNFFPPGGEGGAEFLNFIYQCYIPKQGIEVGKPWKYRESQLTRTLCVLSIIAMTNIFSSSMDSFRSTFNVMSAPNIISKLSGRMNRIVQV